MSYNYFRDFQNKIILKGVKVKGEDYEKLLCYKKDILFFI